LSIGVGVTVATGSIDAGTVGPRDDDTSSEPGTALSAGELAVDGPTLPDEHAEATMSTAATVGAVRSHTRIDSSFQGRSERERDATKGSVVTRGYGAQRPGAGGARRLLATRTWELQAPPREQPGDNGAGPWAVPIT
jgi:hypothetical protein